MAEGPDGNTIIIVKKVVGHGGHHGGAWKVAYADFVTAMMALFLVLWLVNSASVATRERIAGYFKRPGIFEKGSGSPLEIGGSGILSEVFAPPGAGSTRLLPSDENYEAGEPGGLREEGFAGGKQNANKNTDEEVEQSVAESALKREVGAFNKIRQQLEQFFGAEGTGGGLLGQLQVKLDQKGLHIEIMDTPTASMFSLGSARIRPEAEKELLAIAKVLLQLPNPVDIEGHTDSRPFRSKQRRYDNWDLSIDRANSARRALVKVGMKKWQINRVVGFADRRLKVSKDPLHPSNRRISISMRFTEQAAKALSGSNVVETHSVPVRGTKTNMFQFPQVLKEQRGKSVDKNVNQETKEKTFEPKSAENLKVEVSVSQAPGEALAGPDDYEGVQTPIWKKKDYIFGGKNPFFE